MYMQSLNLRYVISYAIYLLYTYFFFRLYEKVYVFIFCSFAPYQNNTSPLYMASQNGHNDVVQSLLRAGADMDMARSIVGYVFV